MALERFGQLFRNLAEKLGFKSPEQEKQQPAQEWVDTGEWVNISRSTLISAIRFVAEGTDGDNQSVGTLFVKMKRDGFIATYPNTPRSVAWDAYYGRGYGSRPGKFIRHRMFPGKPYVGYHPD